MSQDLKIQGIPTSRDAGWCSGLLRGISLYPRIARSFWCKSNRDFNPRKPKTDIILICPDYTRIRRTGERALFAGRLMLLAAGSAVKLRCFRESSFRLEANGPDLQAPETVRNGPIEPIADAAA